MDIIKNNKSNHDSLIETMKSMAESDKPQIGIFWFDKDEFELFGVHKRDADLTPLDKFGRKVYNKLHYQTWSKDKFRAQALGENYERFLGDYTKTPRGRVNQEGDKFLVYVGNWINEPYAKKEILANLIKAEFNLPDFDFVIDSHWDLGHGFSGDKFMN
jgi:hypothetical protein